MKKNSQNKSQTTDFKVCLELHRKLQKSRWQLPIHVINDDEAWVNRYVPKTKKQSSKLKFCCHPHGRKNLQESQINAVLPPPPLTNCKHVFVWRVRSYCQQEIVLQCSNEAKDVRCRRILIQFITKSCASNNLLTVRQL